MSKDKATATPQMDWQQVVLNGGPPCFAVLDGEETWFCGRAERWAGHNGEHTFVSLQDYIRQREEEVRAEPVPIILHCPQCGEQHIDMEQTETQFRHFMEAWSLNAEPQDRVPTRWTNPPHRSHLCHNCGTVWRPADVPTTGVANIQTRGKEDTWTIRRDSQPQANAPGH